MIKITENRSYKYLIYSNIYLVEGVASFLIFSILPIYLKNYRGLSDLAIAILAGVSLIPIVLKPIVAVISDKYSIAILGGRRKPYMIIGFILNGFTLSFIGIIDPMDFIYLFTLFWLLQSLGISLMDVAIDALVTESFPQTNEKVNANIAFYISNISSLFLLIPITYLMEENSIHIGAYLAPQFQFDLFLGGNFDLGFLLAGIICFSLIISTLFLKEDENIQTRPKFSRKALKEFLKSKYVPTLLFMFFLLEIDNGLAEFTLEPFFRISGLTASSQLLYYLPTMIFVILGSISSKWFVKKGIIRSITFFALIYAGHYAILCFLTLFSPSTTPLYYYIAAIIVGLVANAAFILYMTLAMNSADKEIAATTFILFITMINLGRVFGIIIAGIIPFTGNLKMFIIFFISAITMIIRIPVFLKLKELDHGKNPL
ncbi:MAG: MFS transporter [Promethearchaeota archaeon]